MELARYIDHTLLKPEATHEDAARLCAEAREHRFAAVCLNPVYVKLASGLLAGSGVAVATVVGFPLGANVTQIKVREAEQALSEGAGEIDMVMAIGRFKGGEHKACARDIEDVVRASGRAPVKVIIETGLLTDAEIAEASSMAADAGAAFVKTSTGFGPRGASAGDVGIIREALKGRAAIKASGGIRTRAQAMEMIEAGATRIGTSNGVAIVAG